MNLEIRNPQGERIDYTFHPATTDRDHKDLVVLGHGVTGNKGRPLMVAVAEALAANGIHALRISYSGNGDSEGRFVDSTVSKELNDLGAVLDALSDHRIAYAGHSMGGAVGVLRAASDQRIRILVSLAGMVDTKTFAQTEFGDVTPDQGFMWDDEDCPLSSTYMNDMAKINTVIESAKDIHVPWLLVHGTEDDVVPIQDTEAIFPKANAGAERLTVDGGDHVFSESHLQPTADKVAAWITQQFQKLSA